jgi:hypothetical protein
MKVHLLKLDFGLASLILPGTAIPVPLGESFIGEGELKCHFPDLL